MRALCRAFDWSTTPLGPSKDWPQSLRTTTAIAARLPESDVHLVGAELIQIYNDAYRQTFGAGAASERARPARTRLLDGDLADHRPADRARDDHGGPTWHEDQLVPIDAQRAPRGRVVDVQLQPRARRGRPHRRDARGLPGDDETRRRPARARAAPRGAPAGGGIPAGERGAAARHLRRHVRVHRPPRGRRDGALDQSCVARVRRHARRRRDGPSVRRDTLVRAHPGRLGRDSPGRAPRGRGRVRAIRDGLAAPVGGDSVVRHLTASGARREGQRRAHRPRRTRRHRAAPGRSRPSRERDALPRAVRVARRRPLRRRNDLRRAQRAGRLPLHRSESGIHAPDRPR